MTISSEITRIKNNITAAYAALTNKGVTLPEQQNSESLVSCINSLPPFVGRKVDENGVLSFATEGLNYTFSDNITEIKDCKYLFAYLDSLTSLNFNKIKTIQYNSAISMCSVCSNLETVEFPNLETIEGYGFQSAFSSCIKLKNLIFPKLSSVRNNAFGSNTFMWCENLNISFPALNSNSFGSYTNQFNYMFNRATNCTVHFPSNLQSVIGEWDDVTNGFGGTNTTVLFDLPATE